MKKVIRVLQKLLTGGMILYGILMIPLPDNSVPAVPTANKPFVWNRDAEWKQLEQQWSTYRSGKISQPDSVYQSGIHRLESSLQRLHSQVIPLFHASWDSMVTEYMHMAPLIAAKPEYLSWYTGFFDRARHVAKHQTALHSDQGQAYRRALYKLLYGMRAAEEEVTLQLPASVASSLVGGHLEDTTSGTARIFGIQVRSGDILVSRGGADVSAFIARGNDFPGHFSHIALCYIDSLTQIPYLIEAHIEKGVAVSSVSGYVADQKRRFMVLRLRPDLPAVQRDSQLPHKAAARMYQRALNEHIPYDFRLDPDQDASMFCSEVASSAYAAVGIKLWTFPSTISSRGTRNWLHDFGVDHFITQMPTDLEYDPQLTVVGEWRDVGTLFLDHVDNAVMDAWYEEADRGRRLGYNNWKLPLARLVKAWCWLLNQTGRVGIIPEGMSATQALRNERFALWHARVKKKVLSDAEQFQREKGYRPPYWELLRMAREGVVE